MGSFARAKCNSHLREPRPTLGGDLRSSLIPNLSSAVAPLVCTSWASEQTVDSVTTESHGIYLHQDRWMLFIGGTIGINSEPPN